MGVRIKHRRDLAANWASSNPVLNAGELGVNANTNQVKVGDGVNQWSALPYVGGMTEGSNAILKQNLNLASSVVAHGLGGVPKFCILEVECLIAANGYAVGDRAQIVNYVNVSFSYNATTATIARSSSSGVVNILPKSGGAAVNIALLNSFQLRLRPFI